MFTILTFRHVIIILHLTGLFRSENVNVTKHKGETVVFNVTRTEQRFNYLWSFRHNASTHVIANVINEKVIVVDGTRFEGRISTDVDTGSLIISNLTTGDSGKYVIHIFSGTLIVLKEYLLTVTGMYCILFKETGFITIFRLFDVNHLYVSFSRCTYILS